MLDLERNCTIRAAKTKAMINFAVTAKLICAFAFVYADCWFSHATAQIKKNCNYVIHNVQSKIKMISCPKHAYL